MNICVGKRRQKEGILKSPQNLVYYFIYSWKYRSHVVFIDILRRVVVICAVSSMQMGQKLLPVGPSLRPALQMNSVDVVDRAKLGICHEDAEIQTKCRIKVIEGRVEVGPCVRLFPGCGVNTH